MGNKRQIEEETKLRALPRSPATLTTTLSEPISGEDKQKARPRQGRREARAREKAARGKRPTGEHTEGETGEATREEHRQWSSRRARQSHSEEPNSPVQ